MHIENRRQTKFLMIAVTQHPCLLLTKHAPKIIKFPSTFRFSCKTLTLWLLASLSHGKLFLKFPVANKVPALQQN